ncbi:MAG: hypothetical protein ACE5F9_03030 [Phycisphaerae bacterium]
MPQTKTIVGFFARLILFYALLVAPWPGLREAYVVAHASAANAFFRSAREHGTVRFIPMGAIRRSGPDTKLVFENHVTGVAGNGTHNAQLTGFIPTALVIALVLATPIPWRRRAVALALGLILVHVFIALRIEILIAHWYGVDQPWALDHPGPTWRAIVDALFESGVVSPTPSFVVPIVIWAAVSLRRNDWRAAGHQAAGAPRDRKAGREGPCATDG